jgi:ribosomal protein S27E
MKNSNAEQIEKKNDVVSDDALKDVSGGGTVYIEFGDSYTPFQTAEIRVRVINGKSCPSCGGTIGKIPLMPGPSAVKCEKCGTIILETYTDKEIEII